MINYINNNYEKVNDIIKIYIRNDRTRVDDCMGTLIEVLINSKQTNMEETDKFFYIIKIIRNLVYNKKSKYHKLFNTHNIISSELIDDDKNYNYIDYSIDEKEDCRIDCRINEIETYIKKLYNKKDISLVEKNAFMFYYYPEDKINIKNMSLEQVKKIRKTSFRRLEKRSGVYSYSKIYSMVKFVESKVKEKI